MILEVRRVTKSFGGLVAVHELDLTVNEGEVVGLIGPNGSGKTTSFNLISGFLTAFNSFCTELFSKGLDF